MRVLKVNAGVRYYEDGKVNGVPQEHIIIKTI
jgi:hypothetical protein